MEDELKLTSSFSGSNWNNNYIGDPLPWYDPTIYYPLIEKHYIGYPIYDKRADANKVEQAFNIAKVLVEKRIVRPRKIENFIELVNEIISAL